MTSEFEPHAWQRFFFLLWPGLAVLILFSLHPTTTSWTRVIPLCVTSNANRRLRVSTTIGAWLLVHGFLCVTSWVSTWLCVCVLLPGRYRSVTRWVSYDCCWWYGELCVVIHSMVCLSLYIMYHSPYARAPPACCGQDQRSRNPLDWEFCRLCRAGGCLYPCLFDPAYATAGLDLARSSLCGCACVFTNSDWCPPHKWMGHGDFSCRSGILMTLDSNFFLTCQVLWIMNISVERYVPLHKVPELTQ